LAGFNLLNCSLSFLIRTDSGASRLDTQSNKNLARSLRVDRLNMATTEAPSLTPGFELTYQSMARLKSNLTAGSQFGLANFR
jgi:hypothetical protein